MARTLRLVLGDQISDGRLSSLRDLDPATDTVLFAEVRSETGYVRHHKQKIALIFAAMRGFADRVRAQGFRVRYTRHDDPDNAGSLPGEIGRALAEGEYDRVVVTESGEWRLNAALAQFALASNMPVEVRADDRFLCSHAEFSAWAEGKKQLRMEFFYREMRRKTGLLMDGKEPAGGQWNFDKENRKRPPKTLQPPYRQLIAPNPTTHEAMADVQTWFPDHFGDLDAFFYPTTPGEAEAVFADFLAVSLPSFGDYQDFMKVGDPFLWHAIVSAAMNVGLLDPLDMCRRAEAEWKAGRAPLNAVEGFVRQIIGWREYVRGIYFLKMPEYGKRNALGADRSLPWFYWSGETEMACVRDVVDVTRRHAYAHHIQRLMVTGNLAMLLGVHPDQVDEWYLVVYADAYEWVEMPNTRGMATWADGGIMASKPYAASGSYINGMSDYCGRCAYDVKEKLGERACPFNVLYWDFLGRNAGSLRDNPRLAMPYRTLERMDPERRLRIRTEAEAIRLKFGATPVAGA